MKIDGVPHGGASASSLFPEPSIARRVDREMFVLLGGTTALLMQVAHPLVAAGVDQHSDFRTDAVGRLRRTVNTTMAIVFQDDAAAHRAIARINQIHARVRGTSDTGRRYAALDPRLLLWVQTTLVLTSLRLYEHVMGPLASVEREAYWGESKPIAQLLGIPSTVLPRTIVDLEAFEREMLAAEVIPDETARRIGREILRPFGWIPGPLYWPSDALAAALLPSHLRDSFGLRYGRAERMLFRAVILSVLALRRLLPEFLTVLPSARRFERASRG